VPCLYLDIDGVCNPFNDPSNLLKLTPGWDWHGTAIGAFGVYACPQLGEWLRSLDVTIVWATTWCATPEALTAYADTMGLPHDQRLDLPPPPDHDEDDVDWPNDDTFADEDDTCGKREGMKLWVADHPDHAGVWVDDMMTRQDASWADQHGIIAVQAHGARGLASPKLRDAIEIAFTALRL
jgi:hypothetical protein